jgi:hypothetical protein
MALVDVYWENDKIFKDCFNYLTKELNIEGVFFVNNVDYFNLLLQDLWICEIHGYHMVNTIPSYNFLKFIPLQPKLEA